MRTLTLLFLAAALTGCSTLVEHAVPALLPTAKYCHEVSYHRSGDAITLAAQCTAPFGGI